jgi:hypothetical protein
LAAAAGAVNGGGADIGLGLQQQQQQQKEHRRNHRQNNNSNKRHRHSTVALNGDHLDEAAPEEGADRKQQNTASMPKSKFAKTTEESAVLLNDGEIKSAESGTRKNGLLHHSVHELLLKREDQQSSPSPPPITSTSAGGFFSGGMTTTAAMDLSSTGTYEDPDEEVLMPFFLNLTCRIPYILGEV